VPFASVLEGSLLWHWCRANRQELPSIPHSQTLLPDVNKMKQHPIFKYIHMIYSEVIARALPPLTLDDDEG